MFSRFLVKSLLVPLIVLVFSPCAPAEVLPLGMRVDTSLRLGMLFGRQLFQYNNLPEAEFERFRMEFGPRLPILSGMCELTPVPSISGRLAGSISVLETDMTVFQAMVDPEPTLWDVKPEFGYWEVAGLYHLWQGGGYRFSLVAGYRQEYWRYRGEPAGGQVPGSSLRDRFTSYIPFLAMQTSMWFPWWKTRFEILASPFVSQNVSAIVQDGAMLVEYAGNADSGGLIELEVEGTANLTSRVRLGLYGRYSYQELYGEYTRADVVESPSRRLYIYENLAAVGLNMTLLF
jgi:hypothetical protein